MADEEGLLVVVGVDEPAGDAVGAATLDLAGLGLEHVHTVDLHLHLIALGDDLDIRLPEHHEQVSSAGVLQVTQTWFVREEQMEL